MFNVQVSAFTAALKSNFWQAWEETAKVAPSDDFTTIIPSTTRIENFVNWTPAPAMQEWDGSNDYGTITDYVYSLKNKIYRAGVMMTVPDLDDDQTGALQKKPQELAVKAKKLPPRQVMKALAAGTTTLAFDNTNFFAGAHNFGAGNNSLTQIATADSSSGSPTSGTVFKLFALYFGPGTESLKPMVWLHRSGPDFRTNAGTDQSDESLQVRSWATIRGVAGYGIWFNAIYQPFLGLPSTSEMHNGFAAIESAFRTFQLPKSRQTADGEYVHEQTTFSSENLYLAGSTALAEPLRTALNNDWAPHSVGVAGGGAGVQTVADTNRFKGFAKYLVSAYLN